MSQPVQEQDIKQDIEQQIKDYISKRYFTPSVALQLLCSGVDEHTFFDLFKKRHSDLYFLTTEDLIGLSHEHYLKSVSLDNTFEFIDIQLKYYYNSIFNIYICFRFSIIHVIPAKCTTILVGEMIKANLPEQLIILLYYLFDTFYGIMINPTIQSSTKKEMMYNAVESFVLLYSKLYIFLRSPEITLPFNFDIRNPSLVRLLDVMIYKYLDSIHKISSVIIDNYIMCVRHFFNRYISILGTTYTRENIEKIDWGLVHLACYFLNLPNLSFILSNPGSSIPTEIIDGFNRKICIVKESDKTIECTLKEVESIEPKPDPTSISVIPVTIETEFNVMSQKTLDHAIQLVRGVTVQLNIKLPQFSKLNSAGETKIITSLTTALSRKYFVEFLYIFCKSVDQFVLKNSQQFEKEKHDRLIFKSNFSECCCKVPDFVMTTESEIDKQNEVDKQTELRRKKTDARKALEAAEAAKEVERRDKFLKDKQIKEEQQKLREQQKQAAAKRPQQQPPQHNVADDAALPKELTPQEIQQLTIQRNSTFNNYIKDVFTEFSALIQSGQYQPAASMLNEKIPQKLRDNVPWTAANMAKLPPKVQTAYDTLLQSLAPVSVTVASPVAAVASPGAAVASSNSKPKKQQAPQQQAPPQAPQQQAPPQAPQQQAPPQERPLVEKKSPNLTKFEEDLALLCQGNGHQCFAFMFRCSLKQFFRITSVIRKLPDEKILELMGSLSPVSDSASAGAPPIINYMNLQGSGHFLRALFVIALLNGLCRVENVRFSFVGRTFLQLLSCHLSLPQEKCKELYIPKSTSDVDVHVIFNNDVNPELYQIFTISIFNLFFSIPPENIHIHIGQRDDASWALFRGQPNHMYVSSSRGFRDTVKFSLNTQGNIVEVTDISFKKANDFTGMFIFTSESTPQIFHDTSHPPPILPDRPDASAAPSLDDIASTVSPKIHVPDSSVATLRLLNLTYSLDDKQLFFTNPDEACSVQLKFEFPDAQSGFVECLRNFINILYSFLTNKYDFRSRTDYYFIHTSNLLKFLVRAIQMKGISLFQDLKGTPVNPTIILLYVSITREFNEELQRNVHMVGEIGLDIGKTGLTLLNLFFHPTRQSFDPNAFTFTEEYKQTGKDLKGADKRITMYWHKLILNILTKTGTKYKFDKSYLDGVIRLPDPDRRNLYGGVKQQRQKYTKKNRTNKNKNKKYSRKMNKLKQNRKKSLKYYKQNNRKVTKKYRPRV